MEKELMNKKQIMEYYKNTVKQLIVDARRLSELPKCSKYRHRIMRSIETCGGIIAGLEVQWGHNEKIVDGL